jgi:acetolactate synthase-1/2/3 large subunit
MSSGSKRTGAAMLLDQFESDGVDCLFASPIAVMAPIWEELARRGDLLKLRYFRCRHELLAVAAASGYYQATGRSQVAFLPTNLGVQNASMALRTAMHEHVPIVAISVDSLTWGEDPRTDPGVEWPSLLGHAAGPARSVRPSSSGRSRRGPPRTSHTSGAAPSTWPTRSPAARPCWRSRSSC